MNIWKYLNLGVPILEVASLVGVSLSPAGGVFTHTGLCPLPEHQEKTPSFKINANRNTYHCFGCDGHGGPVNLYQKCTDKPWEEVIKDLKEILDYKRVKAIEEYGTGDLDSFRNEEMYNTASLLKLSSEFRRIQNSFSQDRNWIDQLIQQTDKHYLEIKYDDPKRSDKINLLVLRVNSLINKRYE